MENESPTTKTEIAFDGVSWIVRVNGLLLRNKFGNYRRFNTEKAAINAAKGR